MDSSLYGSYVYLVHTSDLNLTSCIERTSVRVSGETAHTCFIHWPDDLGSCAPLHGRRCCPYGGRCELCWSPWIHQLGPTSYWHRRIPWQRLAPGRYSVHCRNTDTQREKIIIHQVPTDKQFDLTVKNLHFNRADNSPKNMLYWCQLVAPGSFDSFVLLFEVNLSDWTHVALNS